MSQNSAEVSAMPRSERRCPFLALSEQQRAALLEVADDAVGEGHDGRSAFEQRALTRLLKPNVSDPRGL
jgi:hypothetical protein